MFRDIFILLLFVSIWGLIDLNISKYQVPLHSQTILYGLGISFSGYLLVKWKLSEKTEDSNKYLNKT
jgi:hypothetical protein